MHVVLLPKSIKLLGKDFFPEAIEHMHGRVQVEVVPRPIKCRESLPFVPGIATDPEIAASPPIAVGTPGHLPCPVALELEDELIQISRPGSRRKYSQTKRKLVIKDKIKT